MSRRLFVPIVLLGLANFLIRAEQAISAEHGSSASAEDKLTFTLPEGWTTTRIDASDIRSFLTTQGLDVLFRSFELPHQTALEWAADEVKGLGRKWAKPIALGDGMQSEGFDLVTPAAEISIGNRTWAMIAWEQRITSQGVLIHRRTVQYFRKDGHIAVEVYVTGAPEQFDEGGKREVEQFLPSIHVKQAHASARAGFIPGHLAKSQVYGNAELGFAFEGPQGWSGLTQREDEKGNPVYDLPPGLRQIFRKEYASGASSTALHAWLELRIAWPEQGVTAMDMLRQDLQGLSQEAIVTPPIEAKLGEKTWAVAEFRSMMPAPSGKASAVRRLYFLKHKEAMIGVAGTSPIQEYEGDRLLFDEAVATMKFSDELLLDMLREAAKKHVEQLGAAGKPIESRP